MNFTFSWIMDKLGYMPKINMEVGELAKAWPFPTPKETAKKTKPTVAKATTRKTKAPTKKK